MIIKPVTHRKTYFTITGIILLVAIAALIMFGLRPSIDFTGGTLLEVSAPQAIDTAALDSLVTSTVEGGHSINYSSESHAIVRVQMLAEEDRASVVAKFADSGYSVERLSTIGSSLGDELTRKAIIAMVLVILAIMIYVAIAFSGVTKPVSSWTYGGLVVFILIHDLIVPAGLFAILGHFAGVEVDTLFVTGMLVILGYSINDTIVIFDRVRENLKLQEEAAKDKHKDKDKEAFPALVERSIQETLRRSINTSGTTMIALVALFVIGAESTRMFALALFSGVLAGTYSSIFLAAPLLVTIQQWRAKKAGE
jgi:preprotein translocase subunit SecF